MRRLLLTLISVFMMSVFLVGCEDSTISKVKKGTLPLDKSTTIGDAFDNYSFFTKTSWKKFETKQKSTVVEFEGKLDLTCAFDDYEQFKTFYIRNHEATKKRISPNFTQEEQIKFNSEMTGFINSSFIAFELLKLDTENFMKLIQNNKHDTYDKMYEFFKNDSLNKIYSSIVVQFKINKNGTFSIGHVGLNIKNKSYTCNDTRQINEIYSNQPMEMIPVLIWLAAFLD